MTGSLLTASEVADPLGVPKSWVYEQSRPGRNRLSPSVATAPVPPREAIEAWLREIEHAGGGT